jgi:hypothetical protein
MKIFLTIGLLACSLMVIAQTKLEKTIPLQGSQKIEFEFDYPELIKLQTSDRKDILITGSVSINRGENDNAFQIVSEVKSNVVYIRSEIKDKDNLPRRVIIKKGEQEFFFKAKDASDPAVQKFLEENGRDYTYMSNGIIHEITLDIYVPKGMACRIDAKYGLVEITQFDGPLTVNAPYGGIDATIAASQVGHLSARTKFGEILTNLDTKFESEGIDDGDRHWTSIQANIGKGPRFDLESKFGKVYLRKPR